MSKSVGLTIDLFSICQVQSATLHWASVLPSWIILEIKAVFIKVSKSWKQFMVSLILPKREQNWAYSLLRIVSGSFFGRIKETINCFWDLLTFNLSFLDLDIFPNFVAFSVQPNIDSVLLLRIVSFVLFLGESRRP